MVTKGFIGAVITLIGGYVVGYIAGVRTVIDAFLSIIPDITAGIAGAATFGLGSKVGREIGNELHDGLLEYVNTEYNLNDYYFVGLLIIIVGLWISNQSGSDEKESSCFGEYDESDECLDCDELDDCKEETGGDDKEKEDEFTDNLKILKKRLAKGEITTEEFKKLKRALKNN